MQKSKVIELLSDFVAIESVSTDPSRKDQMDEAVQFLTEELTNMGFRVKLMQKDKAPALIVASLIQNPKAKTIGIYGHYDVQPEDPVEEWQSRPFELTVKNGKLYGRGVADSKGHIVQNLVAVKRLIEKEALTNNIIFIFEGEEETDSAHFESYAREAALILEKADVFYVVDMGMKEKDVPQITFALRGLIYFELTVRIGEHDLHSGVMGNRTFNPVQILAHLFAKMKDETGKVTIPHFYQDVRRPTSQERKLFEKLKTSDQTTKNNESVYELVSLDKGQPWMSAKIYPALDINGIIAGYTGEGAKTIIPYKATVKFSCRLVEHQTPSKIKDLITSFIMDNVPKGIIYDLKILGESAPFYTSIDNEFIKKTAKAFKSIFGHETLFNRSGGTVAAAEILQRVFNKPVIPIGFILGDSRIHAPNENFDEEMFYKGIEALEKIYGS